MNILIVDDNEQSLYQLQVLLGGNDYQVVSAVNGAEALAKARQDPPGLIISDILMPVMDGFALCREWRKDERLRYIPFVFYTATYTDERDREFALGLGAQCFLVKPQEPEALMHTIREVIQQAQHPSAAAERVPIEAAQKDETGYLKQYNEVLIRKLELKMGQLEQANRQLEYDITERMKMEEALAFKAMLLEISTEASIDGILVVDSSGRIILTNKRFGELWGISQHILDEKDDSKVLAYALRQLKDQQEFSRKVAYLYGHKNEKSRDEIDFVDGRCFDRYSSPLLGADGKYYGRIWYFRDITERKQAENTLHTLLVRHEAILAAVPEIITEVDSNKIYKWVNQAGIDFFGAEVIGKEASFYFIGKQDTYNRVEPILKGDEGVVYLESWQRRKDKEKRLLAWWCRTLKDEKGQVVGALSSARDITEIKQIEEKEREHMHELEIFYKASMGREERIIELKDEVERLKKELEGLAKKIALQGQEKKDNKEI